MREGGLLAVSSMLVLLLACSRGSQSAPPGHVRLLLDGEHAPDVLVEQREVAWPSSLAGSRFLTGWLPGRAAGRRRVLLPPSALRSARLELVNLERKGRTLAIDFAEPVGPLIGTVRVRAGGRNLGTFPLSDPLELPLPMEALALGRVPVDLTFEGDVPGVLAAAVRPTAAAGEGRVEGSDLVQRGDSLVDLVRPVAAGEVLVGEFVPPASPRPGQRFDLMVEREDGAVAGRFSWTPGFWDRRLGRRGSERIELPLPDVAGFARIRLRAAGAGPAGRWKSLGISGEPARTVSRDRPGKVSPPRLIVVYVMDALRADRLGARWGASPTCDRLAREGMAFRAHRSVAPNTLPSTKVLFTGRAFVSRGGWKLSPRDGPTLAELFRSAGYRTGLFSGNVHVGPAFGTDRGFEHVAKEVVIEPSGNALYNDNAARVHAAALAWLRSLPPGAKAFLYLHTIHPHIPYAPLEPYRSRFTAGIASTIDGTALTLTEIKQRRRAAGAADRERLKALYTGSFAYNDAELGRFLAALASWAPPVETLVAVTSDHGEELFDHGGVLHGYTLYEEMLRIPLILWAPGRLRPAAVEAPSDTLDLHATLLALAGLDRAGRTEGRSLLWPVRETHEPRLAAASSLRGGIYAARSDRFKLVWAPRTGLGWGMGEGLGRSHDPEYLFDLTRDPGETVNLAGSGALEAAWLRSRLLAWVERGRTAGEEPEPAPVDRETRERLRALGYVN